MTEGKSILYPGEDIIFFDSDDEFYEFCVVPALFVVKKRNRNGDYTMTTDFDLSPMYNEYVKQEDFLDIVEEVTTKVINERSEEKRQYYKNIFLHSVIAEEVDYDITEKYLNLLSRLENEDIVVFAALHHPDMMNEEKGSPLKNPNEQVDGYFNYSTITKHKSVFWALTKLLGWNDAQVMDSLNVLQRERLIEEGTDNLEQSISGSPIILLKNHLTIKGRSFAKYLMM